MSQQQLRNLQEALNSLIKGRHGVMLNPTVTLVLPLAISHIARNTAKSTTFQAILSQLSSAIQATNPKISQTAVSCVLSTAKLLTKGAQWNQLKEMVPILKLIIGKQDVDEWIRTDARKIIANLESMTTAKSNKVVKTQQKKDSLIIQEKQIFAIAKSGNSELALKKLFDLIVSCVKKRDFFNAERLRDQIYKIDSLVVTEIIQLNEIIDAEKTRSIGKHDLLTWNDLREKMTEDQFSRLFYAMEIKTIKDGTTFVTTGEIADELYFIHSGLVSVSYSEGENERTLMTLESGDIFGENFFGSSFWTASLTTLEVTKVLILNRNKFDELEKIIPKLGSTLQSFYGDSKYIEKVIKLRKIERRKHERYSIEQGVYVQVLGKKTGNKAPFKAQLKNISQGGLSFGVRISNRETIRQLLGEGVKTRVSPATGVTSKFLRGTIVGVQHEDPVTRDCIVHVTFMKELEYESFKRFLY